MIMSFKVKVSLEMKRTPLISCIKMDKPFTTILKRKTQLTVLIHLMEKLTSLINECLMLLVTCSHSLKIHLQIRLNVQTGPRLFFIVIILLKMSRGSSDSSTWEVNASWNKVRTILTHKKFLICLFKTFSCSHTLAMNMTKSKMEEK